MGLFVQDEMRKEVPKIVEQIVGVPRRVVQDEIDPGG